MQKHCSLCGTEQPADIKHFRWIKKGKGRWDSWCRTCYARRTREWNAKNPEERRSRDQAYRDRTKELRREYERIRGKEYNAREAVKECRRKHHQMLKRNCLQAYTGGREVSCECCNENLIEFLTLDHRQNNGKAHREELGGKRNGPRFYKWLQDHGYPQDLDLAVMCMNCNWARHWAPDKRCPHEFVRQNLTVVTPACQAA